MFKSSRCVGCGACAAQCSKGVHSFVDGMHVLSFDNCVACGECLRVCCYDALELCGRSVSAEELLTELQPDIPFYGEKGGVTLSGGEPMMQPAFVYEFLSLLRRRGISAYVETSGYAPAEAIERIAGLTDCFLFDWKLTASALHREYTGVGNELIESNLRLLNGLGSRVVLRCPIIPGLNDTQEHFDGIARLKRELPSIERVELMAYHSMGEGKKQQLGRSDEFSGTAPDAEMKASWISQLSAMGCRAIIG